jgi:spermidine synthase
MYFPGETIIHRSRDIYGDIVITDSALLRTLYFGNEKRQSAMYLQHPGLLVMDYTQAMMMSLIFKRRPKQVLCVGLGGGSLPKFLLRACPEVTIDVVELREKVIQLAHAYFAVPENDKRLNIIAESGSSYFDGALDEGKPYDLMLLDAFDGDGPIESVSTATYIRQAFERLSDNGLLCINLWNRNVDGFQARLRQLKTVCDGSVLYYQLGRRNSNALIFCFRQREMMLQLKRYEENVRRLRQEFGINFNKHFNRLYKQNVSVVRRLLKASA